MMDETSAQKYAASWARKVHADLKALRTNQDGDFYGQLGSLGFDYRARENTLIVRAYIFPNDAEFTAKDDLLPWLNKIAAEDPESVSRGTFEICKARWEMDKDPSLFLRIDLKDGSQSESEVLARLEKLRADAMVWRNTKLIEALDGLVRKRREEKRNKQ